MAYYVHISITFNADSDDIPQLKDLIDEYIADKYLGHLLHSSDRISLRTFDLAVRHTVSGSFLRELTKKKNYNAGAKGELFTWGIVGNFIDVDDFVDKLAPLFKKMLEKEVCVSSYNHILVFEEKEESDHARAIEIFLDDERSLKVVEHVCPFRWGQR